MFTWRQTRIPPSHGSSLPARRRLGPVGETHGSTGSTAELVLAVSALDHLAAATEFREEDR
jgi:hypothetical protein